MELAKDVHKIFDYRQILLDEFEARVNKNSSYSLRAFARDLDISSSRLVDVLGRRYGLSEKAAVLIAGKISLNSQKSELFCALVNKEHARSKSKREIASKKVHALLKSKPFKKLDLAIFDTMSSWYYFAIVELTYLEDFVYNTEWIAKRISIQEPEAIKAIKDMLEIGLLKEVDATIRSTEDYTFVGDDLPSISIKNFHLSLIEKARHALFSDSLDTREFSSLTLGLNSKNIVAAKKKINLFVKEFCDEFGEVENKDDVYALSLQFFKLTSDENLDKGH